MKKVNTSNGRINQKAKTKSRILDETKKLLQKETPITLEDVALKSNISRATIYRYYSNVDLLIMEASLEISHKSPDEFYEDVKGKTLAEGLLYIQEHYNNFAQQNEITFRRYLSAVLSESISTKEKLRGSRRVKTMNKFLNESIVNKYPGFFPLPEKPRTKKDTFFYLQRKEKLCKIKIIKEGMSRNVTTCFVG